MPEQDTRARTDELQFDRVVAKSASAPPSKLAVICTVCSAPIQTEYFQINGNTACRRCRTAAGSTAEAPRGIVPFMTAAAFGLGAGVLGAIIYYAVMAIAHLEIGIVAILIGYMVGYAVRAGARGRGALRYQVLAVALTYASIALAYAPIVVKQAVGAGRSPRNAAAATTRSKSSAVVKQAVDADRSARDAAAATTSGDGGATAAPAARPATAKLGGGRVILGLMFLAAMTAALPVLVVIGSFPTGLISAFIIFLGMRQAWTMTGASRLRILGPYRVGAVAAPAAA